MFDAIILSDWHLGSDVCQVRRLEHFLKHLPPTRKLVLNGDILDSTTSRLSKKHWHVLSLLRKLSTWTHLVWVAGNHDRDAEHVAHLVGAHFKPEYIFASGSRTILCLHGDDFDDFITRRPVLTWAADLIYRKVQVVNPNWALRLKRGSKTFLHCRENLRKRAVEYAQKKRADIVVCGHTHTAEHADGVYANTGCWTEEDCAYAVVSGGEVLVRQYRSE